MRTRTILATVVTWSAIETAALGADENIPVHLYLNRPGTLTKVVSKGAISLPNVVNANPVTEGGQITFTEGANSDTISLPASGWSALGNPPGSKGFKYKDLTGATCRRVLIKGTTIRALCRATTPAAPPYLAGTDNPLEVTLDVGGPVENQRYFARCPNGGEQKGNVAQLTKLTGCFAPSATPPSTPTPSADTSVCCQTANSCGSAPFPFACLDLYGGTAVSGATVCDATNTCVAPPGVPGDCCEGTRIFDFCTMNVDELSCVDDGGTYFANATCSPQGACVPAP